MPTGVISYAMNFHDSVLLRSARFTAFWLLMFSFLGLPVSYAQGAPQDSAPQDKGPAPGSKTPKGYPQPLIDSGTLLFQQNCVFCHGRNATGGESGPSLTASKLVADDVDGDKIGPVVRGGRPAKGMPHFDFSGDEIAALMAYIHSQQNSVFTKSGGRKGVDVSDLQSGNVEAGKTYFNGAGGCAACHSPGGDLAGIATRYQGLKLEERMLYPDDVKSKVAVTLASGDTVTGTVAYLDEFTLGITDAAGVYRSWRTRDIQYKIDAPVNAHVDLFKKYTDADIHNLMAYLQTLR
jgi:cytochrome c oxidase cbb3-type subunit 3